MVLLSSLQMKAKKEIFDGVADLVGFSAKPEAMFWHEVACKYCGSRGNPLWLPFVFVVKREAIL
jgi:hypothetical protein